MEIVLCLTAPPGTRLEGTVRRVGSTASLPFSGVMELLARIEQLADDAPGQARTGVTDERSVFDGQ